MKPIEFLDNSRYGVRLFKVEPTINGKVRLTISACSRNGDAHVSVSIEIERGAWAQIVQGVRAGAFHYVAKNVFIADPKEYIPRAREKCGICDESEVPQVPSQP